MARKMTKDVFIGAWVSAVASGFQLCRRIHDEISCRDGGITCEAARHADAGEGVPDISRHLRESTGDTGVSDSEQRAEENRDNSCEEEGWKL